MKKQNNQFTNPITEEETKFLIENFENYTVKVLTQKLNEKFNKERYYGTIKNYCRLKLNLKKKCYFTPEQDEWLKENVPYMSRKECVDKFYKKFGILKTTGSLKTHCNERLGISFDRYKAIIEFGKRNQKPIGKEIINYQGYIWVKTKNGKTPRGRSLQNYEMKHRLVWKEKYGEIPENKEIMFLDGNKKNCNIDNLMLVDKGTTIMLNKNKFYGYGKEVTEAAIAVCNANKEMNKISKG